MPVIKIGDSCCCGSGYGYEGYDIYGQTQHDKWTKAHAACREAFAKALVEPGSRAYQQTSGGLDILLASAREGDDAPGAARVGVSPDPAPEAAPGRTNTAGKGD